MYNNKDSILQDLYLVLSLRARCLALTLGTLLTSQEEWLNKLRNPSSMI